MALASKEQADALGSEPEFDDLMRVLEADGAVDLDKMWDAVRSLFDDEVDPLFGGTPVTDDLGYGPALFVSPEQARATAAAISGLTTEAFRQRFSPEKLMKRGAYPNIWDRADEMPAVQRDCVGLAEDVVHLYERAAAGRTGILVAML